MPRLLALDTSTQRLVLALEVDGTIRGLDEDGGARTSTRIVPALLALLADAGLAAGDLDAIAFARGPGAFTGLRTACAVAQGLAFGAGRPVVPLDSLLIVAEDARLHAGTEALWVAMDARMDEIYAAEYRWRGGRWDVLQPPALYALDALNAQWRTSPPACVAGSALDAFGARLDAGEARLVGASHDRAAALAAVARRAWQAGEAVDAAQALPLYLRDKVALTVAERSARRAA
jgi:tRNA threonylcarbamoyladenosine biosynthesis protein TsaB